MKTNLMVASGAFSLDLLMKENPKEGERKKVKRKGGELHRAVSLEEPFPE